MAPRVGTRKKSAPKLVVDNGGPPPPSGDNAKKAQEAAEQAQLLSFLSTLGSQQRIVDARKAELDAARAEQTETFRIAKVAGFQRKELSALMADIGCSSKDLVASELRRRKLRIMAGLPTAEEQLKLFEDGPAEAQDQAAARAEGYSAFLRGDDGVPPPHIGARFTQDWLKGFEDGQNATAMAMQMVAEQKKAAASAPKGDDPDRPAGYKVERSDTGEGFITIDANDEEFGKTHETESLAWAACRTDAETVAKQRAKAAEVQAEESEPDDAGDAAETEEAV